MGHDMIGGRTVREATLVLADGSVFEGELFGAEPEGGITTGEVVFNTVMSGYQEVISDPSYAGQIVTFTTSHLGNYGTTPVDDEASRVWCRGVVLREMARRRSSWRADGDLDSYLRNAGIAAIGAVDTRRHARSVRCGECRRAERRRRGGSNDRWLRPCRRGDHALGL